MMSTPIDAFAGAYVALFVIMLLAWAGLPMAARSPAVARPAWAAESARQAKRGSHRTSSFPAGRPQPRHGRTAIATSRDRRGRLLDGHDSASSSRNSVVLADSPSSSVASCRSGVSGLVGVAGA